jgi:hypothetical protein
VLKPISKEKKDQMREGVSQLKYKLDFTLLEEEMQAKEAAVRALAAEKEAGKRAAFERAEEMKQAKLLVGGTLAHFLGAEIDLEALGEKQGEGQQEIGTERLPVIVGQANQKGVAAGPKRARDDPQLRLKKHQSKEQKNFEIDYHGRFKYYDNEK